MGILYKYYRAKYKYGDKLLLTKPVDIMLELSSHCNLGCEYCYHSEANKKNLPFSLGFMSKELAFKVIDDAAKLGVHSIKFNARGEATLNPLYSQITKYARSKANGLTFIDRIANSNFKIPKRRQKEVFDGLCALTKVKVSFDSFNPLVLEKQRTGAKYDMIFNNIDDFYHYPLRKKTGTKLVIQAVRTKNNANEDIETLVKVRWPDADVSVRNMVEGRNDKDLSSMSMDNRSLENRKSCLQAHTRLIIQHDGTVAPCCPSYKNELIIGDANVQSISEIYNGEPARALRQSLKNKTAFEHDPCKTCSSYESYKGYSHSWRS